MLEVRLFGPPEVRSGGSPVPLASSRAQSLLAYLVLQRGAPQRRDHLAFVLWPDSTEKQARTNLRHVLHTLRASLPDADRFLRATPLTLAWTGSWADVLVFDEELTRAEDAGPDVAVGGLRRAVDLYSGELLQGWYDDWLVPERDRLQRCALAAFERLVPLLEARGDLDTAIGYAERARALDPLAEAMSRALIRMYGTRGDRARALRIYHDCARTLDEQVGVAPSPETRAVYEALLPGADVTPRPLGGKPFVGRLAERRQLMELWRESGLGRAQLVVVSGEPGIGKTRLVEELRHWAARHGAITAVARSYAVEGALPYGPVVEWLRDPDIARWRGRLEVSQLSPLARLLPELPELPGDPAPDEPESRMRLFGAAVGALLAGPDPVLLVADDLHAADSQTLQFLHYLLRAEPRARLLVAATARLAEIDEADPLRGLLAGLRALDRCTRIELGRLTPTETGALAGRLADQQLSGADVERLHTETQGNPLFVVETLRAGWPAVGEPAVLTPKVHAVLEARLRALTPGARDLLGVAATVGSSIAVDVLARTRPGDDDGLARDLDELWRRQLLVATGADTYDFTHDKLREVAYGALPPAQRRRNHQVLADVLADVHADRLDAVAGQIAAHVQAAGAAGEAVGWYLRAAAADQRLYADADAADLLDRALAALRSTPASRQRDERELELLTALPGPLAAAEGYASDRLAAALRAALDLTARLGAAPTAPLLRAQGMAVLSRGDFDAALAFGAQLRARGENDDVLAVEGSFVQGVAAYWRGDLAVARSHLEAALARCRPQNRAAHLLLFAQDPQVLSLARLAHVHLFLGDEAEAGRRQRASLDLAREVNHPFTLGAALLFAALLDLELSDLAALRDHVADLDRLRGRAEAPPLRLVSDAMGGYLDVVGGRGEAGLARIDAALADPGRHTAPGVPAILLRIRLAACERSGDTAGAVETAGRLLAGDVRVWDSRARATLDAER